MPDPLPQGKGSLPLATQLCQLVNITETKFVPPKAVVPPHAPRSKPPGKPVALRPGKQRETAMAAAAPPSLPCAMYFLAKPLATQRRMMQSPWLLPVGTLHVAAFQIQTQWRTLRLMRSTSQQGAGQDSEGQAQQPQPLQLPSEKRCLPFPAVYELYRAGVLARRRALVQEAAGTRRRFTQHLPATPDPGVHAMNEAQVEAIREPGHLEHDASIASAPRWLLRSLPPLLTLEQLAATRIAAWFKARRSRWWFWLRFLRPRRMVFQVAALELQQVLAAWMRSRRGLHWTRAWQAQRAAHYAAHGVTPAPSTREAVSLPPGVPPFRSAWVSWDYRAWSIQQAWRAWRDTRVFAFLAALVGRFNASGSAAAVLKGIGSPEAALADGASRLVVRLRLAGGGEGQWPPLLVYRISTAAAVCDVGAFAPRDYAATEARHKALPAQAAALKQLRNQDPLAFQQQLGGEVVAALSQPLDFTRVDKGSLSDTHGWYRRDTRNTWRVVSLGRVLGSPDAEAFIPPLPVPSVVSSAARVQSGPSPRAGATSSTPGRQDVPWHHDRAQRSKNRVVAHVAAKRRWVRRMKALYMGQGAESGGGELVAEGGGGGEQQESAEDILAWAGTIQLDAYDAYISRWHELGTTAPSGEEVGAVAQSTPAPRPPPLLDPRVLAEEEEQDDAAADAAHAQQMEATLASLGVQVRRAVGEKAPAFGQRQLRPAASSSPEPTTAPPGKVLRQGGTLIPPAWSVAGGALAVPGGTPPGGDSGGSGGGAPGGPRAWTSLSQTSAGPRGGAPSPTFPLASSPAFMDKEAPVGFLPALHGESSSQSQSRDEAGQPRPPSPVSRLQLPLLD